MSEVEAEAGKAARELSTVQFPYSDLDDAVSIAHAIQQSGGMPMDRDQIAARLNQKATSGAFITKVSAARMFGLIEAIPGSSKLKISQLGHEAIGQDDYRQKAAKAVAFLNVELYRKLYDEFRNRQLPPRPGGLENAITEMGVAPKQRTNARYAFDRSAKQAGYFEHGIDRLVAPVAGGTPLEDAPPPPPPPLPPADLDQNPSPKLDGVITALIGKLPEKGPWNASDRKVWLTMMAMAFDMAYGPAEADPKPSSGFLKDGLQDLLG